MAQDHTLRPVESWIYDGWYSNNPSAQTSAIARWPIPTSTARERAEAEAFARAPKPETFGCTGCGLYAFPTPGVRCFWCTAEDAKWGS
jgi:hypothetical protein